MLCFSFTVYQDLLAVIATTERRMFRLKFQNDFHISQLQDFLLKRLQFDNISTSLNIEDVNTETDIILLNLEFRSVNCSSEHIIKQLNKKID